MLKSFAILAVAVTAMLAAPVASPQQTAKGWLSEHRLSNSIERHGFLWGGRHQDVHTSSCLGLRQYGVRQSGGETLYSRFKCDIKTADEWYWLLEIRANPNKTLTYLSASMF